MKFKGFREFLKSCSEDVIRKDKTYCEIELSDGNNIFYRKKKWKVYF